MIGERAQVAGEEERTVSFSEVRRSLRACEPRKRKLYAPPPRPPAPSLQSLGLCTGIVMGISEII